MRTTCCRNSMINCEFTKESKRFELILLVHVRVDQIIVFEIIFSLINSKLIIPLKRVYC